MKTIRRRRRSGKTDYKARLALLKSGKQRLIVRKSNRYITAQIVSSEIAQDKVIAEVSSKDLITKGWPKKKSGSLKSLQAAYLTGFLLGKNLKGKVEKVVLDIGLNRSVKGSRLYALVKGALDSGVDVICSEKVLPSDERMKANEQNYSILSEVKEKM